MSLCRRVSQCFREQVDAHCRHVTVTALLHVSPAYLDFTLCGIGRLYLSITIYSVQLLAWSVAVALSLMRMVLRAGLLGARLDLLIWHFQFGFSKRVCNSFRVAKHASVAHGCRGVRKVVADFPQACRLSRFSLAEPRALPHLSLTPRRRLADCLAVTNRVQDMPLHRTVCYNLKLRKLLLLR